MNNTLLITLALISLSCASFIRNNQQHQFWYTAGKSAATSGIPFGDIAWGYCDMKCTYLQHYFTGVDFVVISFTQSVIKPDFAACYIATTSPTGVTTYKLWNTLAATPSAVNSYYEDNCGKDTEDYYAETLGDKPKYKVTGPVLGVGIGTEINY